MAKKKGRGLEFFLAVECPKDQNSPFSSRELLERQDC